MITIQSTNLTSINTMNLTYNCVLTYIWIYSHLSSVIMPFLLCSNTNCSVTHWSRWTLYAGIEKRRMKLAVESPPSFQHSFALPWLELGILRLQMHSYLCWTCSWICNLGKTELEETNGVYERYNNNVIPIVWLYTNGCCFQIASWMWKKVSQVGPCLIIRWGASENHWAW